MPEKPNTAPDGFCQCGCGGRTTIPTKNRSERGVIAGVPLRFISGHNNFNRRPIMEWVHEKVRKDPVTNCWVWTGTKIKTGYGTFLKDGVTWYVHRAVYLAVHGTLGERKLVCHTCDNPSCCNPDHLFLGTHMDNNRDMMSKRRNRAGEDHWNSKLTRDQVENIKMDTRSNRKIAKDYGVTDCAIGNIKNGKSWTR